MADANLPTGFISIDDAIKLIESDTKENVVVDHAFLVRSLPYLRKDGNYNIKLLTRDSRGQIVDNGNKFVQIATDWDKSRLEHAIVEHYKFMSGRDIDPNQIGLKSLTTTIDEDKNPNGRLTKMEKPMTKYGDPTTGGSQTVEE